MIRKMIMGKSYCVCIKSGVNPAFLLGMLAAASLCVIKSNAEHLLLMLRDIANVTASDWIGAADASNTWFVVSNPISQTAGIVLLWMILTILLIITVSDLRSRIIPNRCIVVLLGIWVMKIALIAAGNEVIMFWTDPVPVFFTTILSNGNPVIQCAIYDLVCAFCLGFFIRGISGIVTRIKGKSALGGGDLKLFFTLALLLGMPGTLFMVFLACVSALFLLPVLRKKGEKVFPFGPAIAFAAMAVLFW